MRKPGSQASFPEVMSPDAPPHWICALGVASVGDGWSVRRCGWYEGSLVGGDRCLRHGI